MMEFLEHNYPAIVALITALAALIGVLLQRRRDAADEIVKRVDAATKIVAAATTLTVPLEKRINDLEKDSTILNRLVQEQSKSYDKLMTKYDQVLFELRAVRADRDNLLAERIIYQKRIDDQALTIQKMECRVAELERELAILQKDKSQEAKNDAR